MALSTATPVDDPGGDSNTTTDAPGEGQDQFNPEDFMKKMGELSSREGFKAASAALTKQLPKALEPLTNQISDTLGKLTEKLNALEQANATPDTRSENERLRQEVADMKEHYSQKFRSLDEKERMFLAEKMRTEVRKEITDLFDVFDPDTVLDKIIDSVRRGATGKLEVIDHEGNILYDESGDPMTTETLVKNFLTFERNRWMVKGQGKSGSGATGSSSPVGKSAGIQRVKGELAELKKNVDTNADKSILTIMAKRRELKELERKKR